MTADQDQADKTKEASEPAGKTARAGTGQRRTRATAKKPSSGGTTKRTRAPKAKAKEGAVPTTRRRAPRKAPPAPVVEEAPEVVPARSLPRLLERFRQDITPALMREFGYSSPLQVPRLAYVVLNMGLGEALLNPRAIESATRDLSLISGQRPVTTRARKSIAGFKLREGMAIGVKVTLRGRRMYQFTDRLISSALPRIRDFRGLSRDAFDGHGNYSVGIREHVIFPEIDYNTIDRIRGLQAVIVTTARTDREGLRLLELMGMPFVRMETEARVA